MRFHHLARLFYDWGWDIKHDHYTAFSDYLHAMLKRNRVLTIMDDAGLPTAVIFYFITDDINKVYRKNTWDLVEDNFDGHQFYIDKMVCQKWSPSLYRLLKTEVMDKFPWLTEAYYHRAPQDRCIKINLRREHELQSSISG